MGSWSKRQKKWLKVINVFLTTERVSVLLIIILQESRWHCEKYPTFVNIVLLRMSFSFYVRMQCLAAAIPASTRAVTPCLTPPWATPGGWPWRIPLGKNRWTGSSYRLENLDSTSKVRGRISFRYTRTWYTCHLAAPHAANRTKYLKDHFRTRFQVIC